jgi:hypothetical protein
VNKSHPHEDGIYSFNLWFNTRTDRFSPSKEMIFVKPFRTIWFMLLIALGLWLVPVERGQAALLGQEPSPTPSPIPGLPPGAEVPQAHNPSLVVGAAVIVIVIIIGVLLHARR